MPLTSWLLYLSQPSLANSTLSVCVGWRHVTARCWRPLLTLVAQAAEGTHATSVVWCWMLFVVTEVDRLVAVVWC